MTQLKTPPPFCINCVHFIPPPTEKPDDEPRCRKFEMLDIVLGTKFFIQCAAVRGPEAPCGNEAKLFEPKIVN